MVKSFDLVKRQVLILLVFSLLVSVGAIIHGIFFDLAFEEIKRLTLSGLIFTLVIIFPGIVFLEWIFDINNKKKYDVLERRIIKLEEKRK
jgi:heme/copper-type cytochrome/quinol oxidase subunit 4